MAQHKASSELRNAGSMADE